MSKTLTSPILEFSGTVVIPARMTMPQVLSWERSTREQREFLDGLQAEGQQTFSTSGIDNLVIPVLCEIVEEWHIDGMNGNTAPDNFPATPRLASHKFIEWLGGEVRKVYLGETDIKNE